MSQPTPPPEQPYQIPGTLAAFEPSNLPNWPLTAAQAYPFLVKRIG